MVDEGAADLGQGSTRDFQYFFLPLIMIDDYKFGMRDVNVVDNIQLVYQPETLLFNWNW